jgi:hypothetical protein
MVVQLIQSGRAQMMPAIELDRVRFRPSARLDQPAGAQY